MTEEEAKTMRCCGPEGCGEYIKPLAYLSEPGGPVVQIPGQPRNCIGSACMAWRWEYRTWHVLRGKFLEEDERFSSADKTEQRPIGGYCGLAGQP